MLQSFFSKRARNWLPFLIIAIVALALRLYAIDRLPPGLFGDEAVEGLDALDVLAGNLNIWFHAHLGREPIYVYLVALSYAGFGITPLATRLPAIIAGLLTIPATYLFVREWASQLFEHERAKRLALLSTALIAISFWHIQMTRDAHRDTLLPLVEAIGYWLLWRALRTCEWRYYAGAGAVLGLAIYTYSPGRFVGVFMAVFVIIEFIMWRLTTNRRLLSPKRSGVGPQTATQVSVVDSRRSVVRLSLAAFTALIVMLPLGIYFAQNPEQFSRRFESASILDAASPAEAFATSTTGNLAQFVVPDAGYQSKHYNLPGKPIFDLFLAPWFLAGIVLALTRLKQSQYRFLLLWFIVMATPAFLTADMIPKGVRVLGVVPGVFVFVALAMDWLIERATGGTLREAISATNRARLNRMEVAPPNPFAITIVAGLVALSLIGSAIWTTYDYFVAWANLPDLPLAFDSDQTEVAGFINRQLPTQPIHISFEVYRAPTLMLLGEHVPTSHYVDPATRFKESNARTTLIADPTAINIFVREQATPDEWRARIAPHATLVEQGEYFVAYRLGEFAPPQHALDSSFNPFLKLIGVSRYPDNPSGMALYWQVVALPPDRTDIDATLSLVDEQGNTIVQDKHRFGAPPLEWSPGDTIVEWDSLATPDSATQFSIEFRRGTSVWRSSVLSLE